MVEDFFAIGTVSGAISEDGARVALAYKGNPTKAQGKKTLVPRLAQVMEEVFPKLLAGYVALFSDNSPTIGWVKRLAASGSLLAMQLVRSLTLRLKNYGASTLTPLRISGE